MGRFNFVKYEKYKLKILSALKHHLFSHITKCERCLGREGKGKEEEEGEGGEGEEGEKGKKGKGGGCESPCSGPLLRDNVRHLSPVA